MTCAVCGTDCEISLLPIRNTVIRAPLYFRDPHFHGGEIVPFCSAKHSLEWTYPGSTRQQAAV